MVKIQQLAKIIGIDLVLEGENEANAVEVSWVQLSNAFLRSKGQNMSRKAKSSFPFC